MGISGGVTTFDYWFYFACLGVEEVVWLFYSVVFTNFFWIASHINLLIHHLITTHSHQLLKPHHGHIKLNLVRFLDNLNQCKGNIKAIFEHIILSILRMYHDAIINHFQSQLSVFNPIPLQKHVRFHKHVLILFNRKSLLLSTFRAPQAVILLAFWTMIKFYFIWDLKVAFIT